MSNQQEQLAELKEIRNLMERSSRFLSLSGLAGLVIGTFAIIGILLAYNYLDISFTDTGYYHLLTEEGGQLHLKNLSFLFADMALVLALSLLAGSMLAIRKAKKLGLPIWDITARRLLINMGIPLFAGGIYCLILVYHGQMVQLAPATLIFYGLALLNASKYTIDDIRYLGILEVITGLVAAIFIDYGLLLWAFGFGLLHIIYGIVIYIKYEK
jgi:hypothetical protein